MTPEQRYLLDLNGFFVLTDAVRPAALEAARDVAYACTGEGQLDFEGRQFGWCSHPALAALAFTPAAWPIVLELTRSQPMVRIGSGIHNAPHSGGGGQLHCNGEVQRSSCQGSPSMASYGVKNGKICADFVMFVYLDTVNAGDGGLLLVPGTHKAQFERPAGLFDTYGRDNWPGTSAIGGAPLGVQPRPHPSSGGNRGPPHTVNPLPLAGDIVIMSECVAHTNLPWRGAGHRHVVCLRFKPQHLAHPEEDFTDEEIMKLPPEVRELRAYAPPGQIKSIARGGPVTLSPPRRDVPVTDDERTHGQPHHRSGDAGIHEGMPAVTVAPLPPVPGELTDEQRYLFDLQGYCHLKGAVAGEELAACQVRHCLSLVFPLLSSLRQCTSLRRCQAAADGLVLAGTEGRLPDGFTTTAGGKFLHSHAW